jgi:GntR family transcriptional regulator
MYILYAQVDRHPGANGQEKKRVSVIDKRLAIPYYEQLAELLRRQIGERIARGEVYRLPSENELARRHGISRATVRHALDVLERDGWIYREKGVGSFAAVRRVEHELTRLVSTTEDMRQRGWALVSKVVSLEQVTAPPHVARALELTEGARVYVLCRLRIVDDAPLCVQTAHLPAHLCPALEENDLTSSLYRLLESRYGLRLWTAQETLRARGATHWEARLLQVREGAPVMYTERVTYASTGVPVEYLEAVWRGDRYDFKVTLSRPPS